MKQRYLTILLLLIFPFLLIKELPLLWARYLVGLGIIIYLLAQSFLKYDLKQLGFTKPSKADWLYFLPVIPFTFLILFSKFKLFKFCPPEPLVIPEGTPAWLYLSVYALISTPVQELIYRPFLINHLEEMLHNKKFIFILSVVLFSLLHIAWRAYFVFGSLVVGIYLVWWFMRTRNIVLITIAHILAGMVVVYICFI